MEKLFGFHGRLRRRHWWMLTLGLVLCQLMLEQVYLWAMRGPDELLFKTSALSDPDFMVFVRILAVMFLWPTMAIDSQRFHDRDRTAWPVFVLAAVGLCIAFAPPSVLDPSGPLGWAVMAAGLVLLPFVVWFLILLGFVDGTPSPNRFGPSPKRLEEPRPLAA
jgi:uncharacterized membrane protein YhaH (DUF805 family)